MDFCDKLDCLALVPDKPFQPSLLFLGKAGAYPSEAPFGFSALR